MSIYTDNSEIYLKEENNAILDGYARVTDILSPWCNFDGIDPIVLKNAADRGTRVHEHCQNYANLLSLHACSLFDMDAVDEQAAPYVKSYIQWFDENVEEVITQEKRLYCDEYKFCGQFDAIFRLKGEDFLSLIDNKTPQTKQKSWELQLAAYGYLVKRNYPEMNINRRATLSLKKTGRIAKLNEYTDENSEDLFLGACKLYHHFNGK